MANRTNHKKKHRLRFKNKVDFTVPEDNVLDLKKILSEKKTEEEKKKKITAKVGKGIFSRFSKSREKSKKDTSFLVPEKRFVSPTSLKKKITITNPFKNINFRSVKALGIFILAAVILILPIYVLASYQKADELKGRVLGVSWEAYDHLNRAGKEFADLNFTAASSEFNSAIGYFNQAQEMLQTVSGVVKIVPVKGGEVSSAEKLLKAGEAVSLAGQYVARAFTPLTSLTEKETEDTNTPLNFTTVLLLANTNLKPAISELERANYYLQKVSLNALPDQYQEQFLVIKENLPQLTASLKNVLESSDLLLEILGHDSTRRYLFVFQNNAELRPTGGFIGSFALITLDQGVMKELEVPGGGSYDLSGWLKEQVIAPKPLHLVNPHWYFQDANWFPDFPASAKKLIWFFNESGGPSVDGVIALTPNVIESLLELSGPIDLTEKYGEIISKDNFRAVIQEESEKKFAETRESKKIISELTPLVFNKILELDYLKQLQVLAVLNSLLKEKHLLLFFTDDQLEKSIISRGWGGEIKEASQDYLSIINTNISGGKTDLAMEELINYKVNIQKDGKARATVTVTRIHKGTEGEPFSGIKNIDFMRFYVPKGAKLIEANGFERIDPRKFLYPNEGYKEDEDLKRIEGNAIIDEASGVRINDEFNKTVFGHWIGTEPGKSSQVSITYELPFKIEPEGLFSNSASYSLLVQKQPGTKGSIFTASITFPDDYQILWQYPEDDSLQITKGKAKYNNVLNIDRYLGFVIQK